MITTGRRAQIVTNLWKYCSEGDGSCPLMCPFWWTTRQLMHARPFKHMWLSSVEGPANTLVRSFKRKEYNASTSRNSLVFRASSQSVWVCVLQNFGMRQNLNSQASVGAAFGSEFFFRTFFFVQELKPDLCALYVLFIATTVVCSMLRSRKLELLYDAFRQNKFGGIVGIATTELVLRMS